MYQDHLEGFFKTEIAVLFPRVADSVSPEGSKNCISNKFSGDAVAGVRGYHSEN